MEEIRRKGGKRREIWGEKEGKGGKEGKREKEKKREMEGKGRKEGNKKRENFPPVHFGKESGTPRAVLVLGNSLN